MFCCKNKDTPVFFGVENIAQVALGFDIQDLDQEAFFQRGITLPAEFENMVAKRKSEFLAGRVCAQRALEALGECRAQVGKNQDRSPKWPMGFIGSITHTQNLAVACVAKSSEYRRLGIDIEAIMDANTAQDTASYILTPGDRAYAGTLPFEVFVTLIFSAKESLFKAIYAEVGHVFDFADASLIDMTSGRLRLQIQRNLSSLWPKGATLDIGYQCAETHIYTFTVQEALSGMS